MGIGRLNVLRGGECVDRLGSGRLEITISYEGI